MSKKDRISDLLKAKYPNIKLKDLSNLAGHSVDVTFKFKFVDAGGGAVEMECVSSVDAGQTASAKIYKDKLKHYVDGTMTVDELCQDKSTTALAGNLTQAVLNKLDDIDRTQMGDRDYIASRISADAYIAQNMIMDGKDLRSELVKFIQGDTDKIPKEYLAYVPRNIVPDTEIVNSVMGYIGEGTPAVAMVGPTGSGKSFTAQYIAGKLANRGFAALTIDANERTEGDRLFERDDFNSDGTFILEGTLLEFARRTRERNLRGVVILEEYNAFSDGTRREFYRLFSNSDRYYQIESGNATKNNGREERSKRDRGSRVAISNRVDFSHIQFLITANPITSERYLVDDLKRLSNAEARRVTMVFHDYVTSRTTLRKIFKAIIESKPILKDLESNYPKFKKQLNFTQGAQCFTLLNKPDGNGDRLGFDFGYTSVANWLWTAAIRGNTPDAWIGASLDHLLNPVPDHELRKIIAQRLDSKFGIRIGNDLLLRDM